MTQPILRLSLLQVPLAWEDPEANMRQLDALLPRRGTSDLVILPEMWSTGFSMRPDRVAEPVEGPAWRWMRDRAAALDTAICGSLAVRDGDRYVNRFFALFPDGSSTGYDKRHLFAYGGEHAVYTPGDTRVRFRVGAWNVRPVICYDLRFPAWCRNTPGDDDLLVVVANWPATRVHHWDALARARAIENQCYVAVVNRLGTDGNGLEYPGHSSVYDMNGDAVLAPAANSGRLDVSIDRESLHAFRTRFPFLADRDRLSEIPE